MKFKNYEQIDYLIVFIVLIAFMGSPSVNAKSRDYLLQCQGGGQMTVNIKYNKWVYIRFAKTKYPAGKKRPAAGECAWIDRPVSSREPSYIYYESSKNPIWSSLQISMKRKYNPRVNWYRTPINTYIQKIFNKKTFFVHVKSGVSREGIAVLKIVRFGP